MQGVILTGLAPGVIVFGVWYLRSMCRWIAFLRKAGMTAGSVADRKAVLASAEYQAIRRSVRLPLNLVAVCTLLLYLLLRSL